MARVRQEIFDAFTGKREPEGTQLVLRQPKKPNFAFTGKDWLAMGMNGAQLLAQLDLKPTTHRVLWQIIGTCQYGNEMRTPQQAIAEKLNIDQAKVSKAIKELLDHEIIEYTGTYCRVKTYRLNPAHFWRGSPSSQRETISTSIKKSPVKLAVDNTAT